MDREALIAEMMACACGPCRFTRRLMAQGPAAVMAHFDEQQAIVAHAIEAHPEQLTEAVELMQLKEQTRGGGKA